MRGSVMKRGSTWTYVIALGRDASGKKRQKWVGGHRTKADAEDALIEAQNTVTFSLVNYLQARLGVLLDIGVLQRSRSPIAGVEPVLARLKRAIGEAAR